MPPPLPRDKLLHLGAGAALYAVGHLIAGAWMGALLCLCGGAGKELWDFATGQGVAETADFLATLGGGAIAALVLLALRMAELL